MPTYIECGCCGGYHREGYEGDCRNDEERWTYDEIMEEAGDGIALCVEGGSPFVNIVSLENRADSERRGEEVALTEREKKVLQHEMGLLHKVEVLERQVAILGDAVEQGCEWLEQFKGTLSAEEKAFWTGCTLGYLSTALLRAEGAGYESTKSGRKGSDK